MGGDGPNMLFRANVDKDITQRKVFGQNKVSLKGKNMSDAPLIINVFEISESLNAPKNRENKADGMALLKKAIEKIFGADGKKLEGARCDLDEKKFPLELAVVIAGKEFAKITADQTSACLLQNGETKNLGNDYVAQGKAFSELLTGLAQLKGVKVELEGPGMC